MSTTKSAVFAVKAAADDGGLGIITATASVFGNVDSYGDVVVKGAFAETLQEYADAGDPVPVVWSHDSDDPFAHIGYCTEIKETDTGLEFTAQLDIDSNPTAAQAYRLLKGRRVKQFSFSYSVLDAAPVQVDGQTVLELRKLKLYEVGPTLVGANQQTQLLDVKSAPAEPIEQKAGRVLSAQSEALLRSAHDALVELLSTIQPIPTETDDAGKASAGQQAKDEEPEGAKSEEPPAKAPAIDTKSLENLLTAIALEREINA